MGKKFFYVAALMLSVSALGFTACGDDDDDQPENKANMCTCTEYEDNGKVIGTRQIDRTPFTGASNCSELGDLFSQGGDTYMICQ